MQGIELGRDTTECCDPKTWFPMRVTYQREMKVKAELDRLGIENFVPMRYKVVESRNDGDTELRRKLMPAISNLIFVRSTQERVSELKQSNEVREAFGKATANVKIGRIFIRKMKSKLKILGILD